VIFARVQISDRTHKKVVERLRNSLSATTGVVIKNNLSRAGAINPGPHCSPFNLSPRVVLTAAMSVRISQLLDPARVVLNLQGVRRTQAINEVARRLEGLPQITNFGAFYTELLARERLDTTCIGNEVALPHARTDHATEIVMAAGRSVTGVKFENCNQTVRLMFVLATPKNRALEYLQIVGALCRLLKDSHTRTALMQATTPEAFVAAIAEAEGSERMAAVGR
jgi:mannitol/fructose-specific phosphotransferase system IIA component (Ntr-type)